MISSSFADRLNRAIAIKESACCVGLDPNPALMPPWFSGSLFDYCRIVIDAVADLVPIVKPQSAYFEVRGSKGIADLEETVRYARAKGLLVLMDAKRGDIGSTGEAYAKAYLAEGSPLQADALTVNPYLGADSLLPFLEGANAFDAGIFVLAMTSNPGAADLQRLDCDGKPLYQRVAEMVARLMPSGEGYGPLGIVAGATYPSEAERLRALLPRSIFLVPGLGAQGGDIQSLRPVFDSEGLGAIVSSSRAIMYPRGSIADERALGLSIRDAAVSFVAEVNRVRR